MTMASNLSTLFTISLLFMLLSPSLASFFTPVSGTPEKFCNSTPYPYFCRSSFPFDKPANIHDYGRMSISKTLSHSGKFLSMIQYLLRLPSSFFASNTILALEDCRFLAQLNIDFLSYTWESINYTDSLQSLQASDLQTLLSATLTNLQTCLDGLRASKSVSGIMNTLLTPLSNGTKHCSISLAFFTHGWVPARKKGRILSERKHIFSELRNGISDGLPLKMSNQDQQVYESLNKRKLFQTTVNASVTVSQMVVVNKNGTGNFTTINDAVAAAPNNTAIGSGYFVIYVVKGVYQEYVSISKNKQNIMMIGDGIGKTVITGNRSVVDGWTTFNSATFGKSFI